MSVENAFLAFLRAGSERGGFQTDDVLAAFLPLCRAVVAAHERGQAAPLRGLQHLTVNGNELGFDPARVSTPQRNARRLAELMSSGSHAVEVVGEARRVADVDAATLQVSNLAVGRVGEELRQPVYLPGHVAWEHAINHHDELTDVFSLGLIFASLACDLDFTDSSDLELFAGARENLFALNSRLHPVLATVIREMTELNRQRRAQDLPSLIRRLETYREQPADVDLRHLPGFDRAGKSGRRKLVQTHLRDRLFEISRRNKLLYFRPSLGTLNLTVASVPLVLDYRNIRAEQLFYWHPALATEIAGGAPMSLGKWLRFEDQPYLPGTLDKIISDARRDRAEYGFAQLRLVLVFLRWHNLKEEARERIHSPLLLLPVELTKKKGVRDQYILDPTTSEAEVNPALRHHLKQLYNLDLPEHVDLREVSLDDFHAQLLALIRASEPGVTLHKVDKPQIQLIHERARQRLDQWKRRVKQRPVAARKHGEMDYSYDRENFRPLGLRLFLDRVKPSPAPLRDVAGSAPAPRLPRLNETEPPATPPSSDAKVSEVEREMFSLREGEHEGGGNPYSWEFDLCAITLGNFNYRKMTLVRDYTNLLETDLASDPFDRIFSLDPKQPDEPAPPPLTPSEQFLVIPGDATQVSAIARARTGRSYIIQGPPGTGKSQTITNLIADYVAQGKRVLFVCEKRAAIDVVFHRLRQQGLDELCCLIHDSQTDKKAFILNLKQTSEKWLTEAGDEDSEKQRAVTLRNLEMELAALRRFSEAMRGTPPEAGLAVRALLHRLVELGTKERVQPALPREMEELLPHYSEWLAHGGTVQRLETALRELGCEPCFAQHPLRWVGAGVLQSGTPLQTLGTRLERVESLLEAVEEAFVQTGLPREQWDTFIELEQLLDYARRVQSLAAWNLLGLLNPRSEASRQLSAVVNELDERTRACARAQSKTAHWREKLPASDLPAAREQAGRFQGSFLAFLQPAWWQLRKALQSRYDFAQHAVRPGWKQILDDLAAEYAAADALEAARQGAQREFHTREPAGLLATVAQLHHADAAAPAPVRMLRETLLSASDGPRLVERLNALDAPFNELKTELSGLLSDYERFSLPVLGEAVRDMGEESDALTELLPALTEVAELPPGFARALREVPLPGTDFEPAMGAKTLAHLYRGDRQLQRFDGRALARHIERLEKAQRELLAQNAATIRARVRKKFLEHVNLAATSATQLEPEQKVFKKAYTTGRRELEHEFGKTMRFKSIRDLAAGESGQVIQDLKPIWLMSPLSVSDTLPLETGLFDVVIFDEASQIPLEEAVPALHRAQQAIVVGDEMQLPPTNFFSAAREGEEEALMVEEEGERIAVELDADSFLAQSAQNLPSTLLAWHYRSRYEALISFSNAAFYGGELFTIPDRQLAPPGQSELRVAATEQADANVEAVLARSISFHRCEHAIYSERCNAGEAAYIARLVRGLLARETKLSIGIVAFSEAQQTEIEAALTALGEEDADFATRLEAEFTREEEDQFCGLFVKNLENVQGDERDIIILSICYGRDGQGQMRMNFGPINQRGGEKRLNVIFSRAKHHMAVVSSIRHPDITNDYNDGANALKSFLRYAESVSQGDSRAARTALEGLNPLRRKTLETATRSDAVVEQLATRLRERGWEVEPNAGQSKFRCDLAVRAKGDRYHQLAVLVDSDSHYANADLAERYLTRPGILRAFGWQTTLVLTKDWWQEPDAVVTRLERLLRHEPAQDGEAAEAEPEEAPEEVAGDSPPSLPAPPTTPATAPRNPAAGRRFEFSDGRSNKFWEIALDGCAFTVCYGRLGTEGQSQEKNFPTDERARREAEKLINEKLRKGYREVTAK